MRGKRSKQYRKLMQQYSLHFGFREPYQIILDAEILKDAYCFKMDFTSGLEKTVHGQIKPMITQCCIRHLYNDPDKNDMLIEHAKNFERRRCGHHELEQPLSALECIASVVDPKDTKNNKHKLVVATQDAKLRAYLRSIPGVPLIYLKRSVMIMEPMAMSTEKVRGAEERLKIRTGLKDKKASAGAARTGDNLIKAAGDANAANAAEDASDVTVAKTKKRKRGPSQPNPLSVKKPKKEVVSRVPQVSNATNGVLEDSTEKKKRKRKHNAGSSMAETTTENAPT